MNFFKTFLASLIITVLVVPAIASAQLNVTQGGTGLTSVTANRILYGVSSLRLGNEAALTYDPATNTFTADTGAFTSLSVGSVSNTEIGYLNNVSSAIQTQLDGKQATLGNDDITPDMILSTGQTDEFCLSYEATGDTWDWFDCTGSGGSGDITSVGDVTGGAAFDGTQGTTLTFNNAGGDRTLAFDGSNFTFNDGLIVDTLDTGQGANELYDMDQNVLTTSNVTFAHSTTTTGAIANMTSALLQTGASGIIAEYAGTSCTNQFPRSLSALGIATCASVALASDIAGFGTGVATALGVNIGTAGSFIVNGGALGTPSSGTLTNATGLPIAGITGLGTGIDTWLATPSSANLDTAVTDDTGSGALVFGTAPTFTTSITTPIMISASGDPADTGAVRLGNAENVCWEASPASTDVCLTVSSSELFTMTNGLTVTGTVAATTVTGANVTSGADPGHTHTGSSLSGIDISADTNLTAGRSLTLTGDDVLADAELYTDSKTIYFEDPVAADDFKTLWVAPVAVTITSISCESDQTVNFDLQNDDGTPAGINGSDIACTTFATDSSLAGDTTMAAGDRIDLAVASVSGTPTWVSITFAYTKDD